MMPFSVEKASEGNPWMFQSRTLVGLDRKLSKVKRGEHGTCSSQIWVGKSPEFQPGDLSLSSPQTRPLLDLPQFLPEAVVSRPKRSLTPDHCLTLFIQIWLTISSR